MCTCQKAISENNQLRYTLHLFPRQIKLSPLEVTGGNRDEQHVYEKNWDIFDFFRYFFDIFSSTHASIGLQAAATLKGVEWGFSRAIR